MSNWFSLINEEMEKRGDSWESNVSNWFSLITKEMERRGDSWGCLEASTLEAEDMFREFNLDYEGPNGEQFVLWTTTRVYFSRDYDGYDYVDSVERKP